ncbi:exopolysaccharide biosynthesis polyprenyl glycosylphosphotransferase [Streptomyces cyaneofuscatus]|uniref:exopolysaccharide biosynthesis polyprenyl glycosylphosphotransferase n=1 Tax=Streptomyces cyaneofuscatus TaxID=66883 RepID=UPI002D7821DF|nr:exopolysaccharide biosynthesis polyprenyl glycosylphosphotransferase [Streptomyces cyaneofuscatus]WRO13478.1 exopolysaccharide biosynthesis polyprenyl glycosylphosphotransferase [Streptomyces cyaneofuscatus]
MGHVEIPETDISGPVGLRGAPRPRTAASRNRTAALEQLWRAPTAQRDPAERVLARRKPVHRAWVGALTDLLALAGPAWLLLQLGEQPRPWLAAAVAGLLWTGLRGVRGRYADPVRAEPGGAFGALGDWLVLLGVLAVLHAAAGGSVDPATAVVAVAPGLLVATAVEGLRTGRRGRAVRKVLLVGEAAGLDRAAELLNSRTDHAYQLVAAIPVGPGLPGFENLQVPGRLASSPADDDVTTVLGGAYAHDADLVLVAPGPQLTGDRLRRLGWGLHDAGVALCVACELSGVAAGRVRPVTAAGLTLLHIAPPLRGGPQGALKAALDRGGALFGLLALAPLLLTVALCVRFSSRGPVFHRQVRQGQHNRPFTMWKFRTMVADAEARKAQLSEDNEVDGPLFKMRQDPRVTPVGRTLRRTSIDELPQLFNVLLGQMSLVGPRPPLPEEASRYDEREGRRLAVKPGLTGLWQVSGRSDLSWQETVSLDLWYVDNWSVATDMGLLARTVRAVTDGRGAY